MPEMDRAAWLWVVFVIPVVAFGILASIALVASGLLGILQTSTPHRPTQREVSVAERRALTLLKDGAARASGATGRSKQFLRRITSGKRGNPA